MYISTAIWSLLAAAQLVSAAPVEVAKRGAGYQNAVYFVNW